MSVSKYKIHCVTEGADKYWYLPKGQPLPTQCPTNSAHEVNPASLVVVSAGPLFTPDGQQIVAPSFEYDNELTGVWKGFKYQAQPGVLNIFDEEITTEIYLRGGWYQLLANNQAAAGDYMEFSVVDKNDVLGYFSAFGLTVGVDVLELVKHVRKDYIHPTSDYRQEFMASGAKEVAAGLFLRAAYNSVGGATVDFKVVLKYHE